MRKKVLAKYLLYMAMLPFVWLGLLAGCHGDGRVGGEALSGVRADLLLMRGEGADALMRSHDALGHLWSQLLGNKRPEGAADLLARFAADTSMQRLQDSIELRYPASCALGAQLHEGFARLQREIPALRIPSIYYINSGFNASVLLGDSLLAIGLDRFLGASCPYYEWLGIPHYMARWMCPERVAPQALEAWLATEYPSPPEWVTVLDRMVDRGRLRYCLRYALPALPDSVVLGYSGRELEWFARNERAVWVHMTDYKLLYNRDPLTVSQMTEPGPFTNYYGQDSPGEVGGWIGYRIVSEYMRKNPNTSLADLLAVPTAQAILLGAKYKP